ncbi:MAG TPA: hypothetical protein VHC72_09315, partial [Bryobacteraceae bacterium]|nr:hypothetical protein [Bryobacteraceae bacterium]
MVGMSIPEMQEAAKLGAYLEFAWVRPGSQAAKDYVTAIRAVGPEHCVLSSDLGQPSNPLHTDGLLALYQYLHSQGIPVSDIDRMAKVNPAILLGLETPPGVK